MTEDAPGSRRAKVCMVAYVPGPTWYPPMVHEAQSLAAAGFDVEALCPAPTGDEPLLEEHGPHFRTRRFRVRVKSFFRSLLGASPTNPVAAALQYAFSFAEYVPLSLLHALRSGADVYEANELPALLPALLAAKLRRRPVVYRAHEIWSETRAKVPFAWFWRALDRLLVPHCDQVVTPDENRSRIYEEEFGARRRAMTVRNCPPFRPPVQSTRLRDELARRGLTASTIVLYQGLIDSLRCIEEIAEATRAFQEGVVLVVIGNGHGPWADPAKVLAPFERIVVLPRVPHQELPEFTASADIGILLYRNDCRNNYYCAPNKVFEYMMMGLPVIAPNFPGMLALVEGEEVGLCVDPAVPTQIAAAVNRLASDPSLRGTCRANGLRLSRFRYNWEIEAMPVLERFRELVGAPPALPEKAS